MSRLALILLTRFLYAQTQGSISGTVLDSSGAAVPGTFVIATETLTGVTTKTTSNESELYRSLSPPSHSQRVPIRRPQ